MTEQDRYAPPTSRVGDVDKDNDARRVYSPIQSLLAAFIGGPFAAVYVVRKNYQQLDNDAGARSALIYGTLFVLAVLGTIPFLPDRFPNSVIPIAYSMSVWQIVEKTQMSRSAIQQSPDHQFQSNWNVTAVCLVALVVFFAIAIAWVLLLGSAGVIEV